MMYSTYRPYFPMPPGAVVRPPFLNPYGSNDGVSGALRVPNLRAYPINPPVLKSDLSGISRENYSLNSNNKKNFVLPNTWLNYALIGGAAVIGGGILGAILQARLGNKKANAIKTESTTSKAVEEVTPVAIQQEQSQQNAFLEALNNTFPPQDIQTPMDVSPVILEGFDYDYWKKQPLKPLNKQILSGVPSDPVKENKSFITIESLEALNQKLGMPADNKNFAGLTLRNVIFKGTIFPEKSDFRNLTIDRGHVYFEKCSLIGANFENLRKVEDDLISFAKRDSENIDDFTNLTGSNLNLDHLVSDTADAYKNKFRVKAPCLPAQTKHI